MSEYSKKAIKTTRVDMIDTEELACKILGLDYDEVLDEEDGSTIIENELYEQLEMDIAYFRDLIQRLLPLIDVGESALTGTTYKGFADVENQAWLVKMEVK